MYRTRFIALTAVVAVLFVFNLMFGSVDIASDRIVDILLHPSADHGPAGYIILENRLPMAVTALLAGAGLAISGLLLQTAFRNPLAGPSVLGINSGASLGVAVVMLFLGGSISAGPVTVGGNAAVVAGAVTGSFLVMTLLMGLSTLLRNSLMLLITGIMLGYLTSSVIMLLNFAATAEGIQSYVMWGMSSFNGVSPDRLPIFAGVTIAGLLLSATMIKPLNLLLLGDNYARNLGVNLRRLRNTLILATCLLSAIITAYCGPVAFIGLSVPHISRLIFRSDNHMTLMPATILTGAAVALACNLMCVLPSGSVLPLNAVTPLVGAPVVIWVIFSRRND